jgi:predicted regulator of amino acid metabolism with ACT domain
LHNLTNLNYKTNNKIKYNEFIKPFGLDRKVLIKTVNKHKNNKNLNKVYFIEKNIKN